MLFKEEFCKKAKAVLLKRHKNKVWLRNTSNVILQKYNLLAAKIVDILYLIQPLEICDEFTLYAICDCIDGLEPSNYFSEKEIKYYSNHVYNKEVLKFPLKFKMVQVRDDQWIGTIKVSELIKLGEAQAIHYNENTQRTFDRVVRGDIEYYKISVNMNAVKEIRDSFKNSSYIPNTLTFNMPPSTDFDYKSNTCELVIDSIEYFDILDGYHRYVALTELSHLDEEFDYDMELRIVSFSEETAKQFIFQEDQKTPMKKIDSMSFNQNDNGNKIANMLNTDQKFILKGRVSTKSDQIINAPELSCFVNGLLISPDAKSSQLLSCKNRIAEYFNWLIAERPDLEKSRWNKVELLSCVIGCKGDIRDIQKLKDIQSYLKKEKKKMLARNKPDKNLYEEIKERVL